MTEPQSVAGVFRQIVLSYATPRNAWLADPEPPAFARAIREAAAGDHARVAAGCETARRFDWQAVTSRYFALQDELLARRA